MVVQAAAAAQNNVNVAQNAAVEQRVPAWQGDHDFLVDFSAPFVPTTGDVHISSIGPGVEFNHAYPWNWLMHYYDASYIAVNVNLTKEQAQIGISV